MQQIEINKDIFKSDWGLKIYKALLQGVVITFQSGLYASSMKLLLSAFDTMAFLVTGNSGGKYFKEWLTKYVDLSITGVTADELWEHRNALLHMTTIDSNKVKQGTIVRLIPYIEPAKPLSLPNSKFYSVNQMWYVIAGGFDKFVKDIESNKALETVVKSNWSKIVFDEPSVWVNP